MGLSTIDRGDVGGGPGGGEDIHPPPPKHHIPIYSNSSDIGAVSGGGAETRRTGNQEMLGAGRIGLGGSVSGGEGNSDVGAYGRFGRRRRG